MRRDRYHKNLRKERIVMGASAVFVLAALTMTGVYVKNKGTEEQNDGYKMDYEALEPSKEETEFLFPTFPSDANDSADLGKENRFNMLAVDDALDYAPDYEEADTVHILIPGLTDSDSDTIADEAAMAADAKKDSKKENDSTLPREDEAEPDGESNEAQTKANEQAKTDTEENAQPMPTIQASSFAAGECLSWPISGTVLISYSMDKTVYFATLQQYKYSPGMVISASVGDAITSAASGTVTKIGQDAEIGQYVIVDIGNGYQATYGQLQNIAVTEGGVVDVGSVLGYVAQPTKYYSVEGANAYFSLLKDGEPVDPLAPLW